MLYYSTNHKSPKTDFKQATIQGLAPDKGLYFPESIPQLKKDFVHNLNQYSKEEIAFTVIEPFVGNTIPNNDLKRIISETINFDFPLIEIEKDISSLELFHGPTLAFKDVGARFMSRCLAYFVKDQNQKITVLVATSGDTGGAVANGFFNVEGIEIVILYPSGKVSNIQELQLTTLGKNISALEIDGTFDDCQEMVKQAFADKELGEKITLTSANSINIARWLPQQFYYFFACRQWKDKKAPVISVPSGNFGNLSAGLLAYMSGLPIAHFIAACNANDVVPAYLSSGNYLPKKSVATISNAMDVGDPSNFVRIKELFKEEPNSLTTMLSAFSISDEETISGIRNVFQHAKYLLDPHGGVGYLALKKYLKHNPQSKGIFLETAHPVKFYDVIEPIVGQPVEMPAELKGLLKSKKQSQTMGKEFTQLKDYLLSR